MWDPMSLRGVRLPKYKKRTRDLPIKEAEAPEKVYLSLSMHTGAPAKPIVSVGDYVKRGQLIGEADDAISCTIHSPVSGEVIEISEYPSFRGPCETVVIRNDFQDEEDFMKPIPNLEGYEALIDRIKEAGITGQGGAGFPTWYKFEANADKIFHIIVNGAECEPYSTTDQRIMREYADEIIKSIGIVQKAFQSRYTYIAVEAHMKEEIQALRQAIDTSGEENIEVFVLGNKYPQGYSDVQLYAILNQEVPFGKLPSDVHVLQSNVSTFKAIYDAVFLGKPMIERVVTVSGELVENPQNVLLRIGTPVQNVLEAYGALAYDTATFISGGPMMGKTIEDLSIPVAKDTTTLLALRAKPIPVETPCIRCAQCIRVCPVGIQPVVISNCYRNEEYHRAPFLNVERCIDCGACTATCPANIPLLANIQAMQEEYEKISGKDD